jgi:hypothetical protein
MIVWYIFAANIGMLLLQLFWAGHSQSERIAFIQFEELVDAGKVSEVFVGRQRLAICPSSEATRAINSVL